MKEKKYSIVNFIWVLWIASFITFCYGKAAIAKLLQINGLSSFFVIVILYTCFLGLLFFLIIVDVRKKRTIFIKLLITAMMIIVFCFVLPRTVLLSKIHLAVSDTELLNTTKYIAEENPYFQTDEHEFSTSIFASVTGNAYLQKKDGSYKVLFYEYRGVTFDRILVYSSDDEALVDGDFMYGGNTVKEESGYYEVYKLAPHWYTAIEKT